MKSRDVLFGCADDNDGRRIAELAGQFPCSDNERLLFGREILDSKGHNGSRAPVGHMCQRSLARLKLPMCCECVLAPWKLPFGGKPPQTFNVSNVAETVS